MKEIIDLPKYSLNEKNPKQRKISVLSKNIAYPKILAKSVLSIIKNIDGKTKEDTKYKSNYIINTPNGAIIIDLMIESSGGEKIGIIIPYIKDISAISKAQAIYYILQMKDTLDLKKLNKAILIYPMGLIESKGKIGQIVEKYEEKIFIVNLSDDKSNRILDLATHPLSIEEWLETEFFLFILKICFPGQSIDFLKNYLLNTVD